MPVENDPRNDTAPSSGADIFTEDGYFAVLPEWILDADISAQAVRLYAVLRRYADQNTRYAHPNRKTLAAKLHVRDEKVVDRALADLQRIGAVEVIARYSTEDGSQLANGYLLKRNTTPLPSEGRGGGGNAPGVGAEKPYLNESHLNERKTPPTPQVDDDFESFWRDYPHRPKDPKAPARKAWATARKTASVEEIRLGLKGYPFDERESRRFVPMASTWLNQRRWEVEEPEELAPADLGQATRTLTDRHLELWPDQSQYRNRLAWLKAIRMALDIADEARVSVALAVMRDRGIVDPDQLAAIVAEG